jgi:hypothetical protein
MKSKTIALSVVAMVPLLFSPMTSASEDGRICFENSISGLPVVRGDYRVAFNKGEVAFLVGQDCVTLATGEEECLPSRGTATFTNGKLEINGAASNKIPVLGPPSGYVVTFSESFIELDPTSLEGEGVILFKIWDGSSSSPSLQVLNSAVKAVACPKLTEEDKNNSKQLDEMLREIGSLR